MKRTILPFMIFFILVLFPICCHADTFKVVNEYAFADSSPECFENGQISFKVSHSKANADLAEDLKGIGARYEGEAGYIDIKGTWYDTSYRKITSSGRDQKAVFVSDEYMIKRPGKYLINISGVPVPIMQFYPDLETRSFEVECPGYVHSCKLVNLKIKRCFTRGSYFYAYFSGLGLDKFSKVDFDRDMKKELNYKLLEKGLGATQDIPESSSLMDLGGDEYLLKVPADDLSVNVESIRFSVSGCLDKLYNTSYVKECEFFEGADVEIAGQESLPKAASDELKKDKEEYDNMLKQEQLQESSPTILPEPEEKYATMKVLKFIYSLTSFII